MPEPAALDRPASPVTPDVAQAVRDYLRERRPAMVDLLRRLVEAETPSTEPATQRPTLDLLAGQLRVLGFAVRHLPGRTSGGHLYARPAERERGAPVQLLLGHVDTVWPLGTLARMPFDVAEGGVHGPGVYDMKAGLV